MKLDVIRIARDLVGFKSPSLVSNVEVTRHVIEIASKLGFEIEEIPYVDDFGTAKLCMIAKLGNGTGGLSLMSHDDTVPATMEDGWTSDPYRARISGDKMYGRGSCDMKGPLAATLCAAARFKSADLKAPLYLIVTGDEERHAAGAKKVVQHSRLFKEASEGYGIICEPTMLRVVHAHKGSLSAWVTSKGKPAHTSTTKGVNANLKMIPFLSDALKIRKMVLTSKRYYNPEFDPPYSELNISVNDHNVAINIYPARSECFLLYRPMPGVDTEPLIRRITDSARKHGLKCRIRRGGLPLYTPLESPLVQTALRMAGKRKAATVSYGTDGMAYVKKMSQLVVLGPGDIAQAHTADEWILLEQLHKAVDLYERFIDHVCVRDLP